MHIQHLTQDNLNEFKKYLNEDEQAQLPTVDQLLAYAQGKVLDGSVAQTATDADLRKRFPRDLPVSDCTVKITVVVVDLILVAISGFGLKQKVVGAGIRAAAGTIEAHQSDFTQLLLIILDDTRSKKDVVLAGLRIIKLVVNLGLLGAICSAIMHSLTWYDMILYGVLFVGEVGALFATEGIAALALLAQFLAKGGQTIVAITEAVTACWGGVTTKPIPYTRGRDILVTLRVNGLAIAGFSTKLSGVVVNTPTLADTTPETLRIITNKPGGLIDGDTIKIQTMSSLAQNNNLLLIGTPLASPCTYSSNKNISLIVIRHADPNFQGGEILDGDDVILSPKSSDTQYIGYVNRYIGNGTLKNPTWTTWKINIPPVAEALSPYQVSYTYIVKILTFDGLGIGINKLADGNYAPVLVPESEAVTFIIGNKRKYRDPISDNIGEIELHLEKKIDGKNYSLGKFNNAGQLIYSTGGNLMWKLFLAWNPPPINQPNTTWAINFGDPVQIKSNDGAIFVPSNLDDHSLPTPPLKLLKQNKDEAIFFWKFAFVGLSDTT
jgi:hypothetical protein